MTDPIFQDDQQNPQNPQNQQSDLENNGIFGGSADIFENEDMFEPLQKTVNEEATDQDNNIEETVTSPDSLEDPTETFVENSVESSFEDSHKNEGSAFVQEHEEMTSLDPISEVQESDSVEEEIEADESTLNYEEFDSGVKNEITEDQLSQGQDSEETVPEVSEKDVQESKSYLQDDSSTALSGSEYQEEQLEETPITSAVVTNEIVNDKEEHTQINDNTQEEDENVKESSLTEKGNKEEQKEKVKYSQTPIQNSFYELLFQIKEIYSLQNLGDGQNFNLQQGATQYIVTLGFNQIMITKLLESKENTITFQMETKPKNLLVFVNDEQLYREDQDLTNNEKNTIKVQEKLKKFILLVNEQKETLEKKSKNEKLKGVFRDF